MIWNTIYGSETVFYLGSSKRSLILETVSRSPVFCKPPLAPSYPNNIYGAKLAFIKSSLILMQGKPSADASLITMLSARLLSLPLLDNDLKSFVKNVPIPKVAARATHSSENQRPRGKGCETTDQ